VAWGFELLIATRYLRADRSPDALKGVRWGTVAFALATLVVFAGDALVQYYLKDHLSQFIWDLHGPLRTLKYVTMLLLVLVGFFIELIRPLTLFTTISTFGLFVGTGALVTVLSVMSGFETDLRTKILGTNAHMVVSTPDRTFTDYREALALVEKVPGVEAATPSLTSEVMVASSSNLSGVIIKGIDPATIGRVTDLVRNTDQGSIDNLIHPELLNTLGTPPVRVYSRTKIPDDAGRDGGEASDGSAPDQGPATDGGVDALKVGGGSVPAAIEGDILQIKPAPLELKQRKRKTLPGLILGRELAKNLRVFVGDDVNVVSPMGDIGPTGPIPKAKPFRVAAIFFSGMYEYDSKYVYMLLPAAQRFLGTEDEVTSLELKLKNPDDTEQVMGAVRLALGNRGVEVQDWKEMNRSLFSALKLEKIAMFIALCFIILVAASSIVSNGIMLVLEKGREIAILKSMGASDLSVMRIFLYLGLFMGLVGTTVGVITGYVACWVLDRFGLPLDTDVYYITHLPVKVAPSELAAVLVASFLLSLIATLYPAYLAARLRPVQGLR